MVYAISANNLSKTYQSNKALDNLTIEIPSGVIFGILGPNGAGKSTLINILADTVVKTSGKVEILGHDIDTSFKQAKKLIGTVAQEIAIDGFFSLVKHLEITAGYFGIRPSEAKVKEILKTLALWDKRDNKPRQLSGGMKRRFLVAKAMIHSPKILILDEPTAGVDIDLRNQLWDYIKELNKRGTTIIITTHYLQEAQELCDEIAFINKGKIIKQDKKSEILRELGSRNIKIEFDKISEHTKLDIPNPYTLSNNILQIELNTQENDFNLIMQKIIKIGNIKDVRTAEANL